ncbi:aminoacyl-histidine dipeptidase [Endozoicomonas ascidiicola]|uniref:aminoacyl-histidine dipeptidase n=1 Tax=Endozoicomonas ascidiicola TaxID=1698521 RepID=UPI0008346F42|nr:aminoacyl-histidine dipeptidase [Endozoicomonas ascidiicola]
MAVEHHLNSTSAAPLWAHFQNIASIPHPSGHEEALVRHISDFAERLQLKHVRDTAGNLIVYKPASEGFEGKPAIILQSHLDMVPEKSEDSGHDFLRDPIALQLDGEWLTATHTTLGADNGVGVAAIMAILEDSTLCHAPIEALFTVTEETTMAGAQGLDASLLSGNTLLNLDTEEDGSLYIGCAGGVNVEVRQQCSMISPPKEHHWFDLKISGLKGGHSGCDIHHQRANAIQTMARLLKALKPCGLSLASFHGGVLDNAIPRDSKALVGVRLDQVESAYAIIDQLSQTIRQELAHIDPDFHLACSTAEAPATVFRESDLAIWLNALHSCHHGIKRYSDQFNGVVETSNNLGVLTMDNGSISIDCFTRSLVDSATQELADNITGLFQLTGAEVKQTGLFPGWQPHADSNVLSLATAQFRKLFHKEPEIKIIHAALECGILSAAMPGTDMISFGPQIENAHTPWERVHIASVDRFWSLLKATIESIP